MNAKQEQTLAMLRNAHEFLAASPPTNASGGTPEGFAPLLQRLGDLVDTISRHAVDQDAGSRLGRQETKRQAALRQKLRDEHMQPIARAARATLRHAPGIEQALYAPRARARAQTLLTAAESMAQAAEPYQAVFLQSGRPSDFVAHLRTAAQQFEQSLSGRRGLRGRRSTATQTLPEDLQQGRLTVQMLDDVVRPVYAAAADDELLNGWDDARKLRKFSVSGNGSTSGPPSDPTSGSGTSSGGTQPQAAGGTPPTTA